jgi:hypothetical protein
LFALYRMKPLPFEVSGQPNARRGGVTFMRTIVAVAAACLSSVGLALAADVQSSVRETVNIPAQGLGPALQALSRERNIHVVYVAEDVKGRRTQGANGNLLLDDALQQLLNGTGLTYRYIDDATISILPLTASPISFSSPDGGTTAHGDIPRLDQATVASVSTSGGNVWDRFRMAQADGGSSSSAASQPSAAAGISPTGLEEVIVTARRREENLQSVPVSISVADPKNFVSQGVRSATDLQMVVPGLKYATGGSSFNGDDVTFTIRGQAVTPATTALAVIPYFSDVPLQALTTGQMFDIAAVQVLRGPQGTLFGRVTDGGAILLNPVKPGEELEGYAQVQLGSYDLQEFQGAVTLPVNMFFV